MKAGQQAKCADDLRMSSKEFDRIMSQALRVKPKAQKSKRRVIKAARKQKDK